MATLTGTVTPAGTVALSGTNQTVATGTSSASMTANYSHAIRSRAHRLDDRLSDGRPRSPHRAHPLARPRSAAPADAGVLTVGQLLGVDLLAVPGLAPAAGRLTGLSVNDGSPHWLRLTVALRNVGATFGTPRSIGVAIRSVGGETVAHMALTPGVILPGVTRDFVALLPARLAAGHYRAAASARLGARGTSRSLSFRVGRGGLLPAPSLVPGTVGAGGQVGRPAQVTVALRNQGTRPGAPHGTVSVYPVRDGVPADRPVASAPLTAPALVPGTGETARIDVGRRLRRLRAGGYQAVVRYRAPVTPTQPAVVDLTASPAVSWATSAGRWITGHAVVFALAGGLLAGLGHAGLRARSGRRGPRRGDRITLNPLP